MAVASPQAVATTATSPVTTASIRRRIAHRLANFGCTDALDWPEAHPIDLDSMQLVELALHIEAEFDIDFRDDLIPPAPSLGDFVDMVEAALRQKGVDQIAENEFLRGTQPLRRVQSS